MATKRKQALDDRGLIRWQMLLGSGLITFGALSIPLFQVSGVLDDRPQLPPNGQPDKNLVVTGPAASNPQAGKPAQGGR
jgi:hypothetical protein